MGVIFDVGGGNYDCEAPDDLYERCMEATPRLPVVPWFGNANRFIHPIGCSRPGYGAVLLKRKYLYALPSAVKSYKVEFNYFFTRGQLDTRTFSNLRVVGTPICVTPGAPQDDNATMFVELADRRIDCVGLCGKRYNFRIHPDSTYETASLNTGVAWTWTTLLTDIWNAVGNLGTMPALPVTPAGTPEQIDGMGCRAADLLDDLLMLCGMGVAYDPTADTFSIVSFSANASTFIGRRLAEAALGAVGQRLDDKQDQVIWDQEPIADNLPKLPAYVRVVFPVWSPGGTPIDTATYFVVDVADTTPDATRLASYSFVLVQDFFICRTNQVGTVLNTANLLSRATDVAANWFKQARKASFFPYHQTFSGIGGGNVVLPGAAIDVMCWEDVGDGGKTHVIQTGRLGFPPIFQDTSKWLQGNLSTGHPFGTADKLYRFPFGSLNQADPIQRGANIPPGELRTYGTGPLATASGNTAATYAGGGGMSSIMERIGPLRQWDSAVEARSVDGHGQRLWLAKKRTQFSAFVKITSLSQGGTSGNLYPAAECLIDPITQAITTGAICWWYDPNGSTPALNSKHWSYLDGTDTAVPAGGVSPAKVYMSSESSSSQTKGPNYAVLGYDTTDPIRFRNDPQVVTVLARQSATVGVAGPGGINGTLVFLNSAGAVSFVIAAPGITDQQTINMPGTQPSAINQMLMISQLPGGSIFNTSWLGLYAKTTVYTTQVIDAAGISNWRHIYFVDDLFVLRGDTTNGYTAPIVDLKSGPAYSVLWMNTGGVRPAWTDSPVVNNLTARTALFTGVVNTINGSLTFYNTTNTFSFTLDAPTLLATQTMHLPDKLPNVNDVLKVISTVGNIYQTEWQSMADAGGKDWHYWRHIGLSTRRFYNPIPMEYPSGTGAEYVPFTDPLDASIPVQDSSGVLVIVPYLETRGGTINNIGVYVGTAAGVSGARVRLGIYNASSVSGVLDPTTLVVDAGTVLVDAAGYVEVGTTALVVASRLYYLAIRYDSGSTKIPAILGLPPASNNDYPSWAPWGVSIETLNGGPHGDGAKGGPKSWWRGAIVRNLGVLSTLPATFPGSTALRDRNGSPRIFVGYSS